MFGIQFLLSIKYIIPTFNILILLQDLATKALTLRVKDLKRIEKLCYYAMTKIRYNKKISTAYQKKYKPHKFNRSDIVIWCFKDPKLCNAKFDTLWHKS